MPKSILLDKAEYDPAKDVIRYISKLKSQLIDESVTPATVDGVDLSAHVADPNAHHTPTKEFFIHPLIGTEVGTRGQHVGYRINADYEWCRLSFYVPSDFSSVLEMVVVGIAEASVVGMELEFDIDYGAVGESLREHYLYNARVSIDTTVNVIAEWSIPSLAYLAAKDYVGINVIRPSGGNANVMILGLRFKYS